MIAVDTSALMAIVLNEPEGSDAILRAAEEAIKERGLFFGEGSALAMLEKAGIIKIETPFSRQIPDLLPKK